MAETKNGAQTPETENTGANNATDNTNAVVGGKPLTGNPAVKDALEADEEATEKVTTSKAVPTKKHSFTALILGINRSEKTGNFALDCAKPNGDVETVWINDTLWETMQNRFRVDQYVRISMETRVAGSTTYFDKKLETNVIHNKDGVQFVNMTPASQTMYQREVPIIQGDIDSILSAPDGVYANAIGSYLGQYRRQ